MLVKIEQKFHPLSNSIGAPLNPSITISVTETFQY